MASKSNTTNKQRQNKTSKKATENKSTATKNSTSPKKTTSEKKKPTAKAKQSNTSKAKKIPTETDKRRALVVYELKMVGLFAFTILMVLSLHTDSIGIFGRAIKSFLFGIIGGSAYFFPYLFFGILFIHLNKNFEIIKNKYTIVFSSIMLAIMMTVSFLSKAQSDMILDQGNLKYYTFDGLRALYSAGGRMQSGGALGDAITKTVGSFIGDAGIFITIVVLFLIALLLGTSVSLTEIWESRKKIKVPTMPKIFHEPEEGAIPVKKKKVKEPYIDPNPENRRVVKELKKLGNLKNSQILDFNEIEDKMMGPDDYEEPNAQVAAHGEPRVEVKPEPRPEVSSFKKEPEIIFNDHMDQVKEIEPEPVAEIPKSEPEYIEPEREDKPQKIKESDIDTKTKLEVRDQIVTGTTKEVINYVVPSLDLLNPVENKGNMTDRNEVIEKARILEDTLNSFNVDAKVVAINKGPTITMFELQPSPGVKVSKIVNLSDDIALSLAAHQVRIVAPIPGKSAVGIEVPNKETSMVTLREVLETSAFTDGKSKLDIGLGKDISGNAIVGDLGKMPHLLIAGATGSGKSVCVNTIISSILFNSTPDEVKFLMIDPKVVELSNYNGIPHLILPVVTDPKKASIALNWAVQEMTRRYQLFAETGVRDVSSYNNKARGTVGTEEVMEILPKIVIIIDELADLMMVAPNAVEDAICRLAQMARAAGLHLIVATQRPSVDVITGVIKANIPSRIAFAVSSSTDSRTIIDMGGAEKLLGRGDMLYYPVGSSKPQRVQGAFISDSEVETLVDFVKDQGTEVVYKEEILDQPVSLASDDGDEYLKDAIEFVVKNGSASVSMLQRKFRIGYNRAARIVDMMEERGIVGPSQGSKAREVLLSVEELAQAETES